MAEKKIKKSTITLLSLTTLSVGMFGYSEFIAPKQEQAKQTTVYVANETIPANSKIEAGMFKAVPQEKSYVVQGSVENLNQVVGKYLTGGLNKGELLSDSRITSDSSSEGDLLTEVQITSSIPIANNDNVRLYVKYKKGDNGMGNFSVKELFKSKKVYTNDASTEGGGLLSAPQTATGAKSVYMKLSAEEVLKYEEARSTGEIVMVKILGDEAIQKETANTQTSEEQTELNSDKKAKDNATLSQYVVKDGENAKEIAEKFSIEKDKLIELNEGKTSYKTGDVILVPSI